MGGSCVRSPISASAEAIAISWDCQHDRFHGAIQSIQNAHLQIYHSSGGKESLLAHLQLQDRADLSPDFASQKIKVIVNDGSWPRG